jgi:6-pyruvoyl-tetrahydropterin synthase
MRLHASLEAARRVAARLRSSLIEGHGDLTRAIELDESTLDHGLLNTLDAFVQRFQQTHEQVSRRLLPALYRVLEATRAPLYAELLDWAEGAGVIDRAGTWLDAAETRNKLVDEYPLAMAERTAVLRDAARLSVTMLDDLSRTETFILDRKLVNGND